MNLLISTSQDPFYNLSTEEFLLKHSAEDYIFLYVNKPCVVVGKHQNTPKEINSEYIFEKGILIARRLSGGGAVYHDEGNLNFSFIQSTSLGENLSYKTITKAIYEFLSETLPDLVLSERNDFLLKGKKVSGSAMHIYKNRVLAHGTLLINCNLTNLSAALNSHNDRYEDKAIRSVKAQVQNLTAVDNNLNINTLIIDLKNFLQEKYFASPDRLTELAHQEILELATTKYSGQNWIFGYSPKYHYSSHFNYENGRINYTLEVVKGVIETVNIDSENELTDYNLLIMNSLSDKWHNIYALNEEIGRKNNDDFSKALYASLF